MRVFITGSKSWGDTYLVDLLLDGLEDLLIPDDKEVLVINSDAKGAEHAVRVIAEARHSKVRLLPFGTKKFKTRDMIRTGKPHIVFILKQGSFTPRLRRWRERAEEALIPTYVIEKVV